MLAAQAAGQPAGSISNLRSENGWLVLDVKGYTDPARARLVGVPTPTDGVRRAYEVLLMDVAGVDPIGAMSYIDAETGALLLRDGIVDYAADNPAWKVFPASPPLDYSTTDTRELWCWTITPSVPGCQQAVANSASPAPWDVDAALGTSWFLTRGNNARATEKWFSNVGNQQGTNYAASATRDYVYPWTNQWYEDRCNPAAFTSPELNDIDAARANLHAMHNRMHDWSYNLGFTETTFNAQAFNFGRGGVENDPEHGNAQAGGVVGGPPGFQSRDNANQFSPFGRDRAGDEHVPLAAHPGELLWAVRRRRLRHVGDRARVRAPDLEPHGRRPERKPLGRPGRRHGRELVRPLRRRVPQLAGARPAWRREPVRRRRVRDRRQGGGDPQLRHEHEPAQLLGRRLRLRVQPDRGLHPALAGARRRRDLVGDQLRHPPGADRGVQRLVPGR